MIRVCFVCHGNICRSPMAEAVFSDMVKRAGLTDLFDIFSRATSTEEIGNGLYPQARQELMRRGVPILPHVARQLTLSEYHACDLVLVMDDMNVYNAMRLTGGDPERKIKRLLDYTDTPGEISDPWYTDRFAEAYTEIRKGCEALLKVLTQDMH